MNMEMSFLFLLLSVSLTVFRHGLVNQVNPSFCHLLINTLIRVYYQKLYLLKFTEIMNLDIEKFKRNEVE